MSVFEALAFVPTFVLAFFRIAGMMLFAPLFGSNRIPRRVRVLIAVVLAMSITPGLKLAVLPTNLWLLTAAIAGEMAFGFAMGLIQSFVFIAVQWGGEIIGQQMGFNLSEVFDPQFGGQGSLIGDMYFMLTLVIFLLVGGHHAMLLGVRASFDHFPLLTLGVDQNLFDMLIGFFGAATELAVRLAAPMLVTMLIVDLSLGLVGKMMPQLNVMAMGLSLRAALGLVVVILGIALTSDIIGKGLLDGMNSVRMAWTG